MTLVFCTIVLFIIILLYYSLKYKSEGLNIVYDGVRHRIIRNKNGNYTCFDKNGDAISAVEHPQSMCTSGVEHLYRQTLDPTRDCWAQKINGKMMKVCIPGYPTRYQT